jgi:hypothetical protein
MYKFVVLGTCCWKKSEVEQIMGIEKPVNKCD